MPCLPRPRHLTVETTMLLVCGRREGRSRATQALVRAREVLQRQKEAAQAAQSASTTPSGPAGGATPLGAPSEPPGVASVGAASGALHTTPPPQRPALGGAPPVPERPGPGMAHLADAAMALARQARAARAAAGGPSATALLPQPPAVETVGGPPLAVTGPSGAPSGPGAAAGACCMPWEHHGTAGRVRARVAVHAGGGGGDLEPGRSTSARNGALEWTAPLSGGSSGPATATGCPARRIVAVACAGVHAHASVHVMMRACVSVPAHVPACVCLYLCPPPHPP
jgi:hypothetical protein